MASIIAYSATKCNSNLHIAQSSRLDFPHHTQFVCSSGGSCCNTINALGSISGKVTDENGDPVVNQSVYVWLHDDTYTQVGFDYTDGTGEYQVAVPAGEYAVVILPSDMRYIFEGYDNIHLPGAPEDSTPVQVLAGQETEDIDIQLDLGGTISGRVRVDPTGDPIGGMWVEVCDSSGPILISGDTNAEGNYSTGALPTGDYYVTTQNNEGYFDEWYDDKSPGGGDPPPVSVVAPNDTTGIDFELVLLTEDSYEYDDTCEQAKPIDTDGIPQTHTLYPGGDEDWVEFVVDDKIFCTIETFDLSSSCDTYIYLYEDDCTTVLDYDDDGGGGWSSKIVYYLPTAGTYNVKVRHWNSTTGIGAYKIRVSLAAPGAISGRVFDDSTETGIENLTVVAQDFFGYYMKDAQTDNSGSYAISLLPEGKYLVTVENGAYPSYPYLEFYNNAPTLFSDKVELVEVNFGVTTSEIDFGMPLAQNISGNISGVDSGTEVCIYTFDSGFWWVYGTICNVDPEDYTISGLHPEGSYIVAALSSLGYLFYDNTISPYSAEPVTPPRDDIDFNLNLPGCIEGQITYAATSGPISLNVGLFDSETGKFKTMTWSDSSGGYAFDHLPPKTYQVKVFSDDYCSQTKEAVVGDSGCIEVDFQLTECTIADMNTAAGEGSGRVGDMVTIPIIIENFQNQSYGIEAYIGFDNTKLELSAISWGDIAESIYNPLWICNLEGGVYFVSFFDLLAPGSGTLANLDFTILGGTPGEEIPLPIDAYPACETTDGKIIILPDIISTTTTTPTPPPPPPPSECTTDEDCDDDGAFCNGDEICSGGRCVSAGNPCEDDDIFCNGEESCNENRDVCTHSGNPCPDDSKPEWDICVEEEGICVECLSDEDCIGSQACNEDNVCIEPPIPCSLSIEPDSAK